MSVTQEQWGEIDGTPVHRWRIGGARGAALVLTDLGAATTELWLPAPDGTLADIVLGYDTAREYRACTTYFGAIAGRFANRIRGGRFVLDGVAHQATQNEGRNTLHGGPLGFDKRIWQGATLPEGDGVAFRLTSAAGDMGFPGRLDASVTYRLTESGLHIAFAATTDAPTLCNLVNHCYFNLAGHDSGDVLAQELRLDAGFYTPVDARTLPTGEILSVEGTPFDFRKRHAIGANIDAVPGGYDHNWALGGEPGRLRPVGMAVDPASGRGFDLWTTEPGVQFYTGGGLDETHTGKGGTPLCRYAGFTLETQRFPDAPTHGHFPQARLDPGQTYGHVMELRFLR